MNNASAFVVLNHPYKQQARTDAVTCMGFLESMNLVLKRTDLDHYRFKRGLTRFNGE